MKETYIDARYASFEANVPADLVGKEDYYVEIVAATRKIQLYTTGVAIGTLHQGMQGGKEWSVRLLGCGGTYRARANGAIAHLADVKAEAGGKAVDQAGSGRALGYLISPVAGAVAGDVCEILDVLA
jgi:hypothetical protein